MEGGEGGGKRREGGNLCLTLAALCVRLTKQKITKTAVSVRERLATPALACKFIVVVLNIVMVKLGEFLKNKEM